MLPKRNLLENASLISCSGILICIIIYFLTDISPITGLWFLAYIIILFLLSILFSFKVLHWLLHLAKPIKYDLESFVRAYPYLSFLTEALPKVPQRELGECKEYDTNELSVITTVLERKLVSSWYVPYISEDISFPFACKQMLDQMIGKAFQICNKIETKDVYIDLCVLLTTHLNEYSKALKRHEKCPESSIDSLFKKSHAVFDANNKLTSADHCTNVLRVVLKHVTPWELWDTPQSELLVRVLSKKLDSFIEGTLTNPSWLNKQLITILKNKPKPTKSNNEPTASDKELVEANDDKKSDEPDIPHNKIPETTKDSVSEEPIKLVKGEAPEASHTIVSIPSKPIIDVPPESANETLDTIHEENKKTDNQEEGGSGPLEIKTTNSPVLRQRRGRQGRNEVKIYDRIIEGSIKTWETDMDLQCISVGQDLLAQLDGEMTLSRLWGQDTDEASPNPPNIEPSTLWFGEEELELEVDGGKERSPSKKQHSPKPADALLKDLQSTVHQAKTRIGDLQVACPIDVPCNQPSGDEAAGMVEGLLDRGIAGLRRSLRLGLLDQDKSPTSSTHGRLLHRASPTDTLDTQLSLANKELNGNGAPQLVKQNRVISQDSVPVVFPPAPDSPEPQYEEVADLSTSIAKLRCLLSQSPREYAAEEAWWSGESRHAHIESATLADEFDLHSERNTSPQMSNNIQKLDKLFHRTVTGVFNSIKTAVGADVELASTAGWTYVAASHDHAVCVAVGQLLAATRAAQRVDAALDSLQHLPPPPAPAPTAAPPADLEEWQCAAGCGGAASGGAAAAARLCCSHVAVRLLTLLLADVAENLISIWLDKLTQWLRTQIFAAFEQMSDEAGDVPADDGEDEEVTIDDICEAVMEYIPEAAWAAGRRQVEEAVRLAGGGAGAGAGGARGAAADLLLRALDLLARRWLAAAGTAH